MGLREKIEELLKMSVDDISHEDKLLKFGMDSIKLVELAGLIEENTDVVLYKDDIYSIDGKWLHELLKKYK